MGKLIDADAVLKYMEETEISQYIDELNNGNDNYNSTPLYDFVKDMPTAYDVDAVVEKLEEEIKWYEIHGCDNSFKSGIIGATRTAIEIVKSGGINKKE